MRVPVIGAGAIGSNPAAEMFAFGWDAAIPAGDERAYTPEKNGPVTDPIFFPGEKYHIKER